MSDKEKIEELYHNMYKAMINKDKESLEELHDDSFVLVHMTGLVQDKETYINSIMNNTLNYYSANTDNIDIQIKDNNATVIGQSRVSAAVFGGRKNTWRLQLKLSVRKDNDNWFITKAIASTY